MPDPNEPLSGGPPAPLLLMPLCAGCTGGWGFGVALWRIGDRPWPPPAAVKPRRPPLPAWCAAVAAACVATAPKLR